MAGKSIITQALEDAIVSTKQLRGSKDSYEYLLRRLKSLVQAAYERRSAYAQHRVPRERIKAILHTSQELHDTLDELYPHWDQVEANLPRIRVLTMASLRAMGDPEGDEIREVCRNTLGKLRAMIPEREYQEDELTQVMESMRDVH